MWYFLFQNSDLLQTEIAGVGVWRGFLKSTDMYCFMVRSEFKVGVPDSSVWVRALHSKGDSQRKFRTTFHGDFNNFFVDIHSRAFYCPKISTFSLINIFLRKNYHNNCHQNKPKLFVCPAQREIFITRHLSSSQVINFRVVILWIYHGLSKCSAWFHF
jgi:hypothetical protein